MTILERIKKSIESIRKDISHVFYKKDYELAYPKENEPYKDDFFKYVRHFQKKFDMKKDDAINYASEWLKKYKKRVKSLEPITDMDTDDYIIWVEIET